MVDLKEGFAPCPLLPAPRRQMDYRGLRAARGGPPAALLVEALAYGHYLWIHGLPARALLALTRGLYCDVRAGDPVLHIHPLPYEAMAWMMRRHPPGGRTFLGNPRLSFQHQAVRLRGPRRELRAWRAWGVNAIARRALPALPPDPQIAVPEPEPAQVAAALAAHGLPGEDAWFLRGLDEAVGWGQVPPRC